MDEKLTIKETMELLEGIDKVAVFAGKIMADGKVSLADIAFLGELAKEFDTFAEAVKDISEIKAEIMDLDQEEVIQIVLKVYAIGKKVVDLLPKKA